MNEEEIIATICDSIQERLGDANVSRNFMTQTLLPQLGQPSKLRPEESSFKKAGKHIFANHVERRKRSQKT